MRVLRYEDIAHRLTPDVETLFCEMVRAHLEAGPGDRLFLVTTSFSGTSLIFVGGGSRENWDRIDSGALHDLAGYGLLNVEYNGRGDPIYRVGGEAQAFYRWLMEHRGTPIEQVGAEVGSLVNASSFAANHPDVAHHLSEAFGLLWGGEIEVRTVSEIGDHLRKALMDLAADIAGDEGRSEFPIERLNAWLATADVLERERVVLERLVDLAEAALRLNHRLNHLRDERDKGLDLRGWDEVRRACFVTAVVCHELGAARD